MAGREDFGLTPLQQEADRLESQTGIPHPDGMTDSDYVKFVNDLLSKGLVPGAAATPPSVTTDLTGGIHITLGGAGGGAQTSDAERFRILRGQLRQSGFGLLPFDVTGFLHDTIRRNGSFDSLVDRIVLDPRFQRAFPGILDEDGNLRMAPREYVDLRNSYQESAAQFGVRLNNQQFGKLVAGDVSANELSYRLGAVATARAHSATFRAFNQELKSRGLPTLDKPRDIFDFLAKKKPAAFYDAWNEAVIAGAGRELGLNLSPERVNNINRRTSGKLTFDQAVQALRAAKDSFEAAQNELAGYGISETELQNIALGIAPERKKRQAEKALAQQQANQEYQQPSVGSALTPEGRPVTSGLARS